MKIIIDDVFNATESLENDSVKCIITSPPYFQCRNYNNHEKQIGLEKTVNEYINTLCNVFDKLKPKLTEDGNLFVNIGDKYSKDKSLLLIPFEFANEMKNRGWILRNDIIWHKPNFQPSPVKDRLANAHEHIFHFVKNKKYYYDLDSIRIPSKCDESKNEKVYNRFMKKITMSDDLTSEEKQNAILELENLYNQNKINDDARLKIRNNTKILFGSDESISGRAKELNKKGYFFHCNNPKGKNMGDVFSVNIKSHKGSHEAVFPQELVIPLIKCGSDIGDVVLDCFSGSGTVVLMAENMGRIGIGIELNEEYVKEMNIEGYEITK